MSKSRIEGNGKQTVLWLLIAAGVLGLVFLFSDSLGEGEGVSDESVFRYEQLDPAAYAREVEERVAAICSRVEGAGNAHAVVTLAGGYRAVFASDSQSNSGGYKNELVLIGSGSEETAVLLGYENPTIEGIGIVCEGGDRPVVQKEIISLISATYHISASRIYVVKGDVAG